MEPPATQFAAPRRVFTAPLPSTRQSLSSSATPAGPAGSVETLYNHPNAKIIAFSATARAVPRSPTSTAASLEEDQGTLSWSSQLERTIAVGTFRIYRAPGSVAFLNCGSALQPILPKSQCWCIEEDSSKFVLQIRKPQYWRIELPVVNGEDRERAFLLREIFDQILLFEKTRCPFQRSFTVKLPEAPQTPVKKKPWTPARRSFVPIRASQSPETPPTPISARSLMRPSFYEPKPATSTLPQPVQTPTKSSRSKEIETSASLEAPSESESDNAPKEPERQEASTASPSSDIDNTATEATKPIDQLTTAEEQVTSVETGSAQKEREGGSVETLSDITEEPRQPDVPETTSPEEDARPISPSVEKAVTRDETPVKVKQVVSVIEERLAEEPPAPQPDVNTVDPATIHREPDTEQRPRTPASAQAVTAAAAATPLTKAPLPVATPTISHRASTPDVRPAAMRIGILTPTTPLTAIPRFETQASKAVSTYPSPQVLSPNLPLERNNDRITIHSLEANTPTKEDAAPKSSTSEDVFAEHVPVSETAAFDEVHEGSGQGGNVLMKRKLRRGFAAARSSQPKVEAVVTSEETEVSNDASDKSGTVSPTESADSFHSVRAWQSPITPPATSLPDVRSDEPQTFPYPHDNIVMPHLAAHQRDVSDLTVTPDTRCTWDAMSISSSGASQLSAMTAPDHSLGPIDECQKSNASEDGACYTTASSATTAGTLVTAKRTGQPCATALVAGGPTKQQQQQQRRTRMELLRRMPLSIVAKTCEVLLGPPAYLVTLMLKVASKITAGEWRGMVFGFGEGGEQIPVQWDYSDGDGDLDWDSDDDDDGAHDTFVTPMTGEEGDEHEAADEYEEAREVGGSEDDYDDDDDDDEARDGENTSDSDDTGRTLGVD
ncbi:unnamed protein product [Parascedosporium putredinis]|uniref:Inheritance of peroxisomes protein 1 n=1 Tax=Parascedosporium putredinis TaxID=1442378 RepID=A0A9P1GXF8_9PEZI|nr:unnamed protein product [Parascedosporium putredinis]CAI7988963.1 unnamed protein product [Parascedosporium putredinis]